MFSKSPLVKKKNYQSIFKNIDDLKIFEVLSVPEWIYRIIRIFVYCMYYSIDEIRFMKYISIFYRFKAIVCPGYVEYSVY